MFILLYVERPCPLFWGKINASFAWGIVTGDNANIYRIKKQMNEWSLFTEAGIFFLLSFQLHNASLSFILNSIIRLRRLKNTGNPKSPIVLFRMRSHLENFPLPVFENVIHLEFKRIYNERVEEDKYLNNLDEFVYSVFTLSQEQRKIIEMEFLSRRNKS